MTFTLPEIQDLSATHEQNFSLNRENEPMARPSEMWEASAEAWIQDMDQGDVSRLLLDPVLHRLLGNVEGQSGLDVGCGEGRFCRQLVARGANVIGIDPTTRLLDEAARRGGSFVVGNAEQLPFRSNVFDFAVFYLVLMDIEDFLSAVHEVFRVLRTGGKVVVANVTSMRSASRSMWLRDTDGKKRAWSVERYGETHAKAESWRGIEVINFHRPLSLYLQGFLEAGFRLEFFEEPLPDPSFLNAHPGEADHWICPNFNAMLWHKP